MGITGVGTGEGGEVEAVGGVKKASLCSPEESLVSPEWRGQSTEH